MIKNFVGDSNDDILFDVNTDNQKYWELVFTFLT